MNFIKYIYNLVFNYTNNSKIYDNKNIHDFNWITFILGSKSNANSKDLFDKIDISDAKSVISDSNTDDSLPFIFDNPNEEKYLETEWDDNFNNIFKNENINQQNEYKYKHIDKYDIKYKKDSLENYYLKLNKGVILDKRINFNELSNYEDNDDKINQILSDKKLLENYFKEILKYLKLYSFVDFNYFQLVVIFEYLSIPNGYYKISDYIRVLNKNITIADLEYFYSFSTIKSKIEFKDSYNKDKEFKKYLESIQNLNNKKINYFDNFDIHTENNFNTRRWKQIIHKNEMFLKKKFQLGLKCITRLNYRKSIKFGVTTTCIYNTYNQNNKTFDGLVIPYNNFEINNLLRIIYQIVPTDY